MFMKTINVFKLMCLFIAVVTLAVATNNAEANVELLLAEINRDRPEERMRKLIQGAKKERVVNYYGSTTVSDMQDLIKGFNRQFPFIEVRYTRLGAPALVSKVTSEYQAGVYNSDAVSVRGTFFPELISKNIISKYESPATQFLRKGFVDSEHYLSSYYATGYTMIYNVTKVKPSDVPKSFEGLTTSRWKNRLVMDREEYDWLAGMIDLLGENRAIALFAKLVNEQKLTFKRGHTLMTQLIAAGEHDLLVDGYVPNAVQFKNKGAPIEFVLTEPAVLKPPQSIGITSKALHPYSAALLVDYHLSKPAQEIMSQKQGHWTTRKDVQWLVEPKGDLHVISPLDWGRKYNYLAELFRKTAGQ